MSTQHKKTSLVAEGISEEAVAYYLERHPEFFEHNRQLLLNLSLPHAPSDSTVSLVERQVAMLREKNHKLEKKLRDLVDAGRRNDQLADNVHRLALRLLRAGDAAETVEVLETSLREDFQTETAVLMLITSSDTLAAIAGTDRFLKIVAPGDPALKSFATLLSSGRPRCGQIRDLHRDLLFGEGTDEVGSAAMLPLGQDGQVGILAIGSADADRFHPAMSTDFLARIGSLAGEALTLALYG